MPRAAIIRPTKDALRSMSAGELTAYIKDLKLELTWRPKSSPAYKAVSKQLEIAEKLRELQNAREVAGDV